MKLPKQICMARCLVHGHTAVSFLLRRKLTRLWSIRFYRVIQRPSSKSWGEKTKTRKTRNTFRLFSNNVSGVTLRVLLSYLDIELTASHVIHYSVAVELQSLGIGVD